MSILNFSTTNFKLLEKPNLTIGEIDQAVASNGTDLFVVHDSLHHASAVVIPEVFKQIRDTLGADDIEAAFSAGLLDALRVTQIVVRDEQPAARVAKLAHARNAGIVIVVDRNDKPVGLFVPAMVMKDLPQTTAIQFRSTETLRKLVESMSTMAQFPSILESVETEHAEFASERLNTAITEALVCYGDANSGKHTPVMCQCPEHPNSKCEARKVST